MPITSIQPGSPPLKPAVAAVRQSLDYGFATLLDNQGATSAKRDVGLEEARANEDAAFSPTASPEAGGFIPLGKISPAAPSVSHLLNKSPFRHECWDIIAATVNQGKKFTAMRPGVMVSLNPTTKELVWTESANRGALLALTEDHAPEKSTSDGQIILGTIDRDHPTLSHLLKSNPRYSDNAWNIIFSATNRDKPYASILPGSMVTINSQTLELSFHDNLETTVSPTPIAAATDQNPPAVTAEPAGDQKGFSEKLAESVKSYLGQPYHDINCYDLVVRGLKNQGVRYSGSGGLLQHLERLAKEQGLPANAYQNGEGLIEVGGNKLYDESFARINNVKRQSSEVLAQLQPLLHEGMLLSFSTPSRGHTGIIAKRDGLWTYVNSGMIDHQVNGGKISRRVGEETLADEIKNWFALARRHRTSLKISAGMFDPQKLQAKGSMATNNRSNGQDLI